MDFQKLKVVPLKKAIVAQPRDSEVLSWPLVCLECFHLKPQDLDARDMSVTLWGGGLGLVCKLASPCHQALT